MPYAQAACCFVCARASGNAEKVKICSTQCGLRAAACGKYELTFSETSNVTMTESFSFKTIKLEFSVHEYFYMGSNH